jgi:hypothetical protein
MHPGYAVYVDSLGLAEELKLFFQLSGIASDETPHADGSFRAIDPSLGW